MRAKLSILHPNRTTPHHIDIILYIYTLSCFSFVGDTFTRGRLRADRFGYNAFWRVHLNGDVFIDRFEWVEVCICTLCAVKYKGGVSNGSRNAKSDGVHKNENAAKRRRCG